MHPLRTEKMFSNFLLVFILVLEKQVMCTCTKRFLGVNLWKELGFLFLQRDHHTPRGGRGAQDCQETVHEAILRGCCWRGRILYLVPFQDFISWLCPPGTQSPQLGILANNNGGIAHLITPAAGTGIRDSCQL